MQQVLTSNNVVTYDYTNLTLLTKNQIIELLLFLTERINKQFIMMGGLLYLIRKNKWYEPHQTFQLFCDTLVGIQYRKAMYLIQIYESLIKNHIPFEAVSVLGYSKMVSLSTHLTESNYTDMVTWAKGLSIQEIDEELKLATTKSKAFIAKVQASAVLSPDYKETVKTVKPDVSVLKQLITVTSIDLILQALKVVHPDKDFALA